MSAADDAGLKASRRPTSVKLGTDRIIANGDTFSITFDAPPDAQHVSVVLHHGGFVTHSLHMGQRMILLDSRGWLTGQTSQQLVVTGPPSSNIAIPGPYVLFVMVDGVPAMGQFVQVSLV